MGASFNLDDVILFFFNSDIRMDNDVDIETLPISEWMVSVRHICFRYRNNRCQCRISPTLSSMSMPTYDELAPWPVSLQLIGGILRFYGLTYSHTYVTPTGWHLGLWSIHLIARRWMSYLRSTSTPIGWQLGLLTSPFDCGKMEVLPSVNLNSI